MNARELRFLCLVGLSLLICFSPSKALGQIVAIMFIIGMIVFVRTRPGLHILRYSFLLLVYANLGVAYYVIMPEFSFINFILFFVTISSTFVLLCDMRSVASKPVLQNLGLFALVLAVFQAFYGMLQAFVAYSRTGSLDIGNGDLVRGTIDPGFTHISSASNPIYAILLSTLLIYIIAVGPLKIKPGHIFFYAFIGFAWLLASVMHTILFFIVSLIMSFMAYVFLPPWKSAYQKTILKHSRVAFVVIFILGLLLPVLLPRNFSNIPTFVRQSLAVSPDSHSEKARATYNTLVFLPRQVPLQVLIGVGPGQYSSRASLMMSGEYLRDNPIPFTYIGSLSDRFVLSLWRSFQVNRPNGGSTYFPFYSWMSLYGEMGLIGLGIVNMVLLALVVASRIYHSVQFPRLPFIIMVLTFYLALLGFQDNYWEFTQAVFPAFLFIKLGLDYLWREAYECRNTTIADDSLNNSIQYRDDYVTG